MGRRRCQSCNFGYSTKLQFQVTSEIWRRRLKKYYRRIPWKIFFIGCVKTFLRHLLKHAFKSWIEWMHKLTHNSGILKFFCHSLRWCRGSINWSINFKYTNAYTNTYTNPFLKQACCNCYESDRHGNGIYLHTKFMVKAAAIQDKDVFRSWTMQEGACLRMKLWPDKRSLTKNRFCIMLGLIDWSLNLCWGINEKLILCHIFSRLIFV